ncbi:hypothetical protein [Kordia sp.]|uniref:hypothetical protein n=1 Tax=Kordia sp. TaxID=1965332 RepID=UPI003D6B9E84
MKKKSLKNLNVNKSTISNLNGDAVKGGTIRTFYTVCGTGPHTIACTLQAPACVQTLACTFVEPNCGTYNSKDRCQTNEVDANTLPIC